MEQRRRRRVTDPTLAAHAIATGLREVADYAEGIGPDADRMTIGLQRVQNQLGNMSGVCAEYLRDLADADRFGTPPEFDVWGDDDAEVADERAAADRG